MSELEALIETAVRLSNRLATMAEDERKFGYEFGKALEDLSYDTYVVACNLKGVNDHLTGGVA